MDAFCRSHASFLVSDLTLSGNGKTCDDAGDPSITLWTEGSCSYNLQSVAASSSHVKAHRVGFWEPDCHISELLDTNNRSPGSHCALWTLSPRARASNITSNSAIKDPRRLRSPSFRMVFTCDSCHLIQYMQTKYVQKGTSEVLISPVDLNSALSETWRCRLPVQARAKQEDADAGTVLICGRTICRLDSKRAARPCRMAHPVDLDRMACLRKCLRAGRWWSAFHLCGGRGLESRRGRMRFFR